ncbi:SPP1 gp7 family putative phage head morphogenesis protein [Paraburkholderia tropica]|uniref:phage head morphogenesis protein n=1 Tax=Paraburkholderia tropica TaxID=92647 RepID=UPI0017C012B4|nr:phage minor head protein [Paraburkholderia tropica]MBB3004371.1 SPP1 gp7 family putative phage head morphogenesis protein [Paraburkholderia tropica]
MLTLDRKRNRNPVKTQRIEQRYALQLRKVAQQVGSIISPFTPGDMSAVPTIEQLLKAYSDMLKGWATQTASNMLMDVALRDEHAWQTMARELSAGLRQEIRNAPTGQVMKALLAEQVALIQSIPLEAAQRIHRLTLEGIEDSTRFQEIAKEIQRSEEVSTSKAVLIARTEVSRSATTLTQARAVSIGSEGYFWETSHDGTVRSDHRELDGKFFTWDNPPVADKRTGARAHPGCIYNCRCWARVALPR